MEEMVILTGGYYTENKVTVYNTEGWVEDWAQLQTGRYWHACGHFINMDNQVVRQHAATMLLQHHTLH